MRFNYFIAVKCLEKETFSFFWDCATEKFYKRMPKYQVAPFAVD